ncbi:MAG TPA: hypothetical protein VJ142_03055, partial [Candidatus Nanoarchaeia archaeon]|nr:hypothetical protein [Candidatus Nanoarchaeia archaeon]
IVKELKESFSKALSLAISISYTSPDTIKFLIQKAERQEKALGKFIGEKLAEKEEIVNDKKDEIGSIGVNNFINQKINSQEENK